jgi:diphosphoinositol-polyphosphate diphosphatase
MTKVKIPPEDRIYDSDGYWLRAACVCVKDHSESEVLLITSSAHPDRWIVPGGKMQLNESPEFSAMREAIEEGGAIGLLGRSLGTYDNTDRRHRTKVFVLYVNQLAEDYDDKDLRRRKWFSVDEAQKLLVAFKPLSMMCIASNSFF